MFVALAAFVHPTHAALCAADKIDQTATVRYVIDGDTVVLSDQRHVRLIGLNAPEIAHDDQPAEPLGDAARTALVHMLAQTGRRVGLRFGRERYDRHGRTLGYLYLPDGTSVTAALLRGGWGAAIAIPPNLRQQACYRAAERTARRAHLGVWREARYEGQDPAALKPPVDGFRILRGRVTGIRDSRYATWVQMDGGVSLRIDRDDLSYFRGLDLHGLRGRTVIARGWLVRRRGRLHMSIHHPLDLTAVPVQAH